MDSILEMKDIPYLNGTKRLLLQAEARLDDVFNHPQCPAFLYSALCGKVSWQKRSEFTVARVLAAPGLAPQLMGALLAWGAGCILDDGSERPLESVAAEPGAHHRVRTLVLPLEVPGRVWGESRTGSTPEDWSIVWAMAVVDHQEGRIGNARIALSGVWPQSVALAKSAGALAGSSLNDETIRQAADAVAAEANPRGDFRGSAEYRKSMAGVLTRRALQACLEGAAA